MSSPTLTTLAALKSHLGETGTDSDDRLTAVLVGVEAGVRRHCRNDFVSVAATEYHDGTGEPELLLPRRPVTAVAGVWVDTLGAHGQAAGAFGDETEWAIGTDFTLRSLVEHVRNDGVLLSLRGGNKRWAAVPGQGHWPAGLGNVKVTYTAGWTSVPADVVLAVHQLAAAVWQQAAAGKTGPLRSETIGRYSYELMTGADQSAAGLDLTGVRNLLAPYVLTDLF